MAPFGRRVVFSGDFGEMFGGGTFGETADAGVAPAISPVHQGSSFQSPFSMVISTAPRVSRPK